LAKQRIRDEPIVITIDLTDEFYDNWLRATRISLKAAKVGKGATAEMKDLKRESPQIPVEASRNG
jgi:hypothetical protein